MINEQNYYETVRQMDMSQWPESLRKGHQIVDSVSLQGKKWASIKSNEAIHKAVLKHFQNLEDFSKGKSPSTPQQKNLPTKTEKATEVTAKKTEPAGKPKEVKPDTAKNNGSDNKRKPARVPDEVEKVELVSDEVRLLKRFYQMIDKVRTREQLMSYLTALQRAITERRIRKTSAYAEAFRYIQNMLVDFFNDTKKQSTEVNVPAKILTLIEKGISSQHLYPSVPFIKRFVSLHGKEDVEEKADKLLNSINSALDKEKINKQDKYYKVILNLHGRLEAYLKRPSKRMEIPPSELNGLEGILHDCNCAEETNEQEEDELKIVNSLEFVKQQFDTIGLTGKWLDFIGDPSPGFTVMVFGKPKMGKSYLCIDFAGYLAQHHGKVLYIAKEEKLHDTLKRKLVEMNVPHENLDVAAGLPSDLSPYQFIFLDSVNKLGLKPNQLEDIESEYPDKSFIYIFQTVKTGAFRGDNSFQHHVDVVVEVPKKGKAVQFGRFNQGGTLNIFDKNQESSRLAA